MFLVLRDLPLIPRWGLKLTNFRRHHIYLSLPTCVLFLLSSHEKILLWIHVWLMWAKSFFLYFSFFRSTDVKNTKWECKPSLHAGKLLMYHSIIFFFMLLLLSSRILLYLVAHWALNIQKSGNGKKEKKNSFSFVKMKNISLFFFFLRSCLFQFT